MKLTRLFVVEDLLVQFSLANLEEKGQREIWVAHFLSEGDLSLVFKTIYNRLQQCP